MDIYGRLYECYGPRGWWPARTAYEMAVGAVLTQNTAWGNVEKAIANFGGRLTPQFVLGADMETLVDIIRPSGFFNQKARYLKAMTEWFVNYEEKPLGAQRAGLLAVRGVGKETADSILLYGFGLRVFVIDAYTRRLVKRMGLGSGEEPYDTLRGMFEAAAPEDAQVYNEYHALIVIHAKERCRVKPLCGGCPLKDGCLWGM